MNMFHDEKREIPVHSSDARVFSNKASQPLFKPANASKPWSYRECLRREFSTMSANSFFQHEHVMH